MLNTDILDTLFETQTRYHSLLWSVEDTLDVSEVRNTVPALQPVARIVTGEADAPVASLLCANSPLIQTGL